MNEQNHTAKTPNRRSKVVVDAFSPVGVPRTLARRRYFISLWGYVGRVSDRGGETNVE